MSDPLISIVAAGVNSPDWAELFVKAVGKFSTLPHEIIIIDNGSLDHNLGWLRQRMDIRLVENGHNLGHGGAMDQGTALALGRYVCVLDIDSFPIRAGWDEALVALYTADFSTRMIGVRGPEHKPFHPPLFFYERDWILDRKFKFEYQPTIPRSTDTAQLVYWQIIEAGYRVERLEKGGRLWPDVLGETVLLAGEKMFFHAWYGTRFQEFGNEPKRELDGFTLEAHLEDKRRIFLKPEVISILEG